ICQFRSMSKLRGRNVENRCTFQPWRSCVLCMEKEKPIPVKESAFHANSAIKVTLLAHHGNYLIMRSV
ncbi:MAG: hypothetical protein ACK55Z_25325, partial [bacterium]